MPSVTVPTTCTESEGHVGPARSWRITQGPDQGTGRNYCQTCNREITTDELAQIILREEQNGSLATLEAREGDGSSTANNTRASASNGNGTNGNGTNGNGSNGTNGR